MLNAIKEVAGYMRGYGWRDDLKKLVWELYECALRSELSDDWDGAKRIGVFWDVDAIADLVQSIGEISEELEPFLEFLEKKYKAETPSET